MATLKIRVEAGRALSFLTARAERGVFGAGTVVGWGKADPVAQSVEHAAFNRQVVGSIPTRVI